MKFLKKLDISTFGEFHILTLVNKRSELEKIYDLTDS
jgi:hypothetical protein